MMYSYIEIERFVKEVETSNHILLFYDGQESKRKILYSYLADGLRNGKGVAYITTEETEEDIKQGFEAQGIDYTPNLNSGNIVIKRYDEWYIKNGKVEPMRIINNWHTLNDRFAAKGLGMRATGETSCFFEHDKVRELLHYEYALNKVLTLPMDVICAYNLQTIVDNGYTDMIMPLVRAHGKAVFTSEGGTMLLEPQDIEASDLEKLLQIEI